MNALLDQPGASLAEQLHALYHDASKHSVYQSIPAFVARALGYQEEIHSLWRSDTPRYDYIAARLNLPEGARVADIGANTGFFSVNLAHGHPALRVAAYELNPRHAEFIRLTAGTFSLENIEIRSQACDLRGLTQLPVFDAVLLLNVLHHAGFDFDRDLTDDNDAFTAYAIAYLTRMRTRSWRLVFQVGSNRGGDKGRPLFHRDDDLSRLGWVSHVLREAGWCIDHLGYPQLDAAGAVVFRDVPPAVLDAARTGTLAIPAVAACLRAAALDRFPGEFHRRPLVIASAIL